MVFRNCICPQMKMFRMRGLNSCFQRGQVYTDALNGVLSLQQIPSSQDVKIQNVGSWSNLATALNTAKPKQSTPIVSRSTNSSFEMFKKVAQEKKERVRLEGCCRSFFCCLGFDEVLSWF